MWDNADLILLQLITVFGNRCLFFLLVHLLYSVFHYGDWDNPDKLFVTPQKFIGIITVQEGLC